MCMCLNYCPPVTVSASVSMFVRALPRRSGGRQRSGLGCADSDCRSLCKHFLAEYYILSFLLDGVLSCVRVLQSRRRRRQSHAHRVRVLLMHSTGTLLLGCRHACRCTLQPQCGALRFAPTQHSSEPLLLLPLRRRIAGHTHPSIPANPGYLDF